MHRLDHLIWETFDLKQAEIDFEVLTGVAPKFGGEHTSRGTHNSLLSLGGTNHLEIIAPNPARAAEFGFPKEAPAGFKGRLMTFGCRCNDFDYLRTLVERARLELASEFKVEREATNGELFRWRTMLLGGHDFGHFVPFFTARLRGSDPTKDLTRGCELKQFSIMHPRHQELARLYEKLELGITVKEAKEPAFNVVLQTPNGLVELGT